MERKIEIIKAKLKKGVTLEVEYQEHSSDGVTTVSLACSAKPHDDLRIAFRALNVHLAYLCEQYDKEGKLSIDVEARGFSIKGEDDNEGVTITGIRMLAENRSFALNAPFLKWGNAETVHNDASGLDKAIIKCKEEVRLFLFDNKHQPDNQLSLFDKEVVQEPEQDPDENQ